jgi:hypothetical protein
MSSWKFRRAGLVRTDVSEEYVAFVFRAERLAGKELC